MKIKFITTGGTIDKVYFDAKSEYEVGPPQVAGLLREANVTFEFEVEAVLHKDSLDLTDADRELIRARIAAHERNGAPRSPGDAGVCGVINHQPTGRFIQGAMTR